MILTNAETVSAYLDKGWWDHRTVDDLFKAAITTGPDAIALVDPINRIDMDGHAPQSLSWATLDAAVDQVASNLIKAGLKKDDRILAQLPNTVDAVIVFLAAARLGLIVSPVVMQYRAHELRHIIERIEPVAFVTVETFAGFDHAALARELASETTDLRVMHMHMHDGSGLLNGETDTVSLQHFRSNNPINSAEILTICWTSGTESRSKGVPRSHAHWVLNADVIIDATEMTPNDVLLNPFPLVNIGSIGGLVLPWLQIGAKLVLHHPFDISIFLEQIQTERVTYTIAPPAVLGALLKQPALMERFDISSMRAVASGSAPLSPWLIETWKSDHNIEITNVFGSNEGSSLFSTPRSVPDPAERARYFPRFGADGVSWNSRAAEVMQSRLIDPDTRAVITEPGQVGELQLAGATIISGYWNSPDLNTRAFDADGWFSTGDLFEIAGTESLSRLYSFVGRSKEIIMRGGVNISPAELDDLIVDHPKIREAATVGLPDDRLGERIAVAVVPHDNETVTLLDISQWLENKGTAIFKRPEFIVTVDRLPRNAMNKVVRDTLRDVVTAKL
ncbi:AMP-dependent acyl-CoA synthetase [Algimonas ampicilliniresistens]|uniref:AMP-dependent acyl-CoA synthetase n=1 Tax=Algimonas ampicilliniresistens TaxID=1298735 RepID=A0ABQ5VDI2_9PROT|nr:class I adenylate-forming enzyme family protein [Algimonas ampicilliniresistens]GLQ25150.1 AMP-dependent acyl-CoA synthetase [Algimonas ampicilliniresistens]